MTGWGAVERELRRGDLAALERLLLDPALERRDVARELGALLRSRSRTDWRRSPRALVHGVLLTAVASQPTPARITATLARRSFVGPFRDLPVDPLVRVALARDVAWHGDLALRLLDALTPTSTELYPFAAALLVATGTPVPQPVPAGAVVGWLEEAVARLEPLPDRRAAAVADVLLADPLALHLLPGIFADGTSRALGTQLLLDHRGTSLLLAGIAEIARRGLVDGSQLLAGAVERLLRGGSAAELRPFTQLLDRLGPTLPEWQPHGGELVALTRSDVGPVVSYALRVVERLHRYDLISDDAVVEASSSVLRLPAKGTARNALSLLEALADRDSVGADELARAAAGGFDHPAHDVAERALELVARLLPRLAEGTREDLADAVVVIDPALQERATAVFGGAHGATGTPVPRATGAPVAGTWDAPPPPERASWPVADVALHDVVSLIDGSLGGDLLAWESAFAALVRLRATAPGQLRDAVAGLTVEGHPGGPGGRAIATRLLREIRDEPLAGLLGSVRSFLSRLAGGAASAPGPPGAPGSAVLEPDWDAPEDQLLAPLPHLARLAEAARHLRGRPVPMLVATPSHTDGSIAVDVLLGRLMRAARERWEPWPVDLEQALLRVTIPDAATRLDVARAAHALATAAGTRLARWLEQGGLPDPGVTVSRFVPDPDPDDGGHPGSWLAPTVTPHPVAAGTTGPLTAALLAVPATGVTQRRGNGVERPGGDIGWLDLVPLPHHPEVQAAWMLPVLSWNRDCSWPPGAVALRSFDGRAGAATGAVLALLLTGKADARTTAVDVALHLTGVGQPWGAWTALRVVDEVGHGAVLTRVVEPLRTIATAGGAREVLVMLVTALPTLLTSRARGLPDVLALTSTLVVDHGVPEHAGPELPEMLGLLGRGRSRSAAEARRLLDLMDGPAT